MNQLSSYVDQISQVGNNLGPIVVKALVLLVIVLFLTIFLGAPGRTAWSFKAVGKGRAYISLHYLRPWEKNKPPARTKNLEVEVE